MTLSTLSSLFEARAHLRGTWIPQSDNRPEFLVGKHPDIHQEQTFEALKNSDSEAVLNTNPTGAGKTLSWVAPTIRSGEWGEGWIVLATYPTKALVEDQYQTILELFKSYYTSSRWEKHRDFRLAKDRRTLTDGEEEYPISERVIQATSDSIDEDTSTTTAVKEAYENVLNPSVAGLPTVVLTTPDTLTLIAAGRPFDSEEASVLMKFDKIVVDEFHLANPRGKRLLPFHLDVNFNMPSYAQLDNLIFLSATPLPECVERVEKAFEILKVTDKTSAKSKEGTRQILPEAELFVTTREMFTNGEWLAENIGKIADFYDSSGQMLIVLDSVREVDRVYSALEDQTELNPGRIYGWKKAGRSKTIEEADVVVGNTAVEVGIDFDKLNRVISTAYDPTSALQRLGRMRYREEIDGYKIALITTPQVQSEIVKQRQAQNKKLKRKELEKILVKELRDVADMPYYELLCAAYAHYLWYDSEEYAGDKPLREMYGPRNGETAEERYSKIVYKHFAEGASRVFGEDWEVSDIWDNAEKIRKQYYQGNQDDRKAYPVLKEMHTFRSSSLSCLILDLQDGEEPIKNYQLHHVLKYCKGYFVKNKREFEEECEQRLNLDKHQRSEIDYNSNHVCAFFVAKTKEYMDSRYYRLKDYAWSTSMGSQWKTPGTISEMWSPAIETNPAMEGTEHINLDDRKILARYVERPLNDAISEYNLGPYANATQVGKNSTILLWQDGILAEVQIAQEYFKELREE